MTQKQTWTRRQFSQAVAAIAGAAAVSGSALALPAGQHRSLVFVGRATGQPEGGAIEVFEVSASHWKHAASMEAASPACLLVHPTLPVLYAVHDVPTWQHLPRGAVSAYRFDWPTGQLSYLETQPLSLAATHPGHATLTAHATHLFVAARQGGIYNLLPIAPDGSLLPVSLIRKEFGWEHDGNTQLASPRAVALHPDGTLLAADAGQQRLKRFGLSSDALELRDQVQVQPGWGPSQLVVAPSGSHAYSLASGGDVIAIHALGGELSSATLMHAIGSGAKSIGMAPGGRFLVSAGRENTGIFRVDRESGTLTAHARLGSIGPTALCFSPDAQRLIGLDNESGNICTTVFDGVFGTAGQPETVARVEGCVSLACS